MRAQTHVPDETFPQHEVEIPVHGYTLPGLLTFPPSSKGLVLFAHGSGSSRKSPRNRFVATVLNQGNLGTLLFDLLISEEEEEDVLTRRFRFDVELLAQRLIGAIDWARTLSAGPPEIGLFGASTGAAAALVAAVERQSLVSAVVSRGGRPDLAGSALDRVFSPTLLIVGEKDEAVLDLNRNAFERIPAEKALAVVPGATHLFEEPGALEKVANLARQWFGSYLGKPGKEKFVLKAD